ncbi:MAG: hypothetical protein QOF02_3323, partial [Blastocatellia bacterium]|nr:hypothetical protein [Blastocatellia bacterium]
VRHLHKYQATETRRGRPSPWKRQDLLVVSTQLATLLERETSPALSLSSFIDHYLRLLDFPADLVQALAAGEINLFEAEQLDRMSARRLGCETRQARRLRTELLSAHLQSKGSGDSLRRRVNELLRPAPAEAEESDMTPEEVNLEDFDPYDATHLFWDQIKQLGFGLRLISREDVTDEEIDELLRASEPVLTILARIQRRKERKKSKMQI